MTRRLRAPLVGLLLATACASTSPQPAFRDVATVVEQRTGLAVRWDQGTREDLEVGRAIDAVLARELTVADAVRIALVRNPSLLATYEGLGVAQADLVQAGLLKNPTVGLALAPSEYDTLSPPIVGTVSMDFLDLFTLPARKKIAATELEAVKMRVADAVLDTVAKVRAAYFNVQGAQRVAALVRTIAEAAGASAEVARRQRAAGNLSDLDLATFESQEEQASADLDRAEGQVLATREALTQLMGLWGKQTEWRLQDALPELPPDEGPLTQLESRAVAQRLDLAARRREFEALARAVSLVESTRWIGGAQAQLEVDPFIASGHSPVGPGGSVQVPLFDQGQAAVARAKSELRESRRRLDALAIEVRSEVRAARDRVVLARKLAERYRTRLVPLRERIVALSQQHYDAMLMGVYQLVAAKQAEVTTYREYLEAVRDYWIARSDLERAVGGRVGPEPAEPAPPREETR